MYYCLCSESSELYATSSHDDVRVWHAETGKELLRLVNPNMICHAVIITPDGRAIITGKALYQLNRLSWYIVHLQNS